ncbi:MAG: ribonuclease P protein component [Eubacterium sp.]|nr:ribonuclease P protein component [Eubacterium sp.]
MAKIFTLKKQKDFQQLYQKGKVFGNRNLVIYYLKNGKDTNRLGIVVSKKISNRAVVRNKIRRQIKEAYRQNASGFSQGYDLILIAKASCKEAPYQVIEKSLGHLFYKQRLLKEKR